MDLNAQRRNATIASIKDDPQLNQFFESLESLTSEQLHQIHAAHVKFMRECDEETFERYQDVSESRAGLSASAFQHVQSRLTDTARHKIDLPELDNYSSGLASALFQTAPQALNAIPNRHKLTDEEYQWFIGPYLAAGFPRETFYPEEPPPQG